MNKKLLALSIVASSGLMAQDAKGMASDYYGNGNGKNQEQTGYCNNCCCRPCCCKEPCVPKPKKCIDCECYTPAYYDLQCNCGFFIDAAFLYWYARETNLSYALETKIVERIYVNGTVTTPELVFAPQKYLNLGTKWDPGVRVGIGYNDDCDGWDYYLNWTYFRNNKKSSTAVSNYGISDGSTLYPNLAEDQGFLLINPWINAAFHSVDPQGNIVTFDSVAAKWRLIFNQIDLELGRKYWLSKCFTMRPYVGLRGAWTNTKFHMKSTSSSANTSTTITNTFVDDFKTKNWGVGFLSGFQPNWFFCDNFILYGNADIALIWGEFEVKKKENYTGQTETTQITVDPSYTNTSNNKFAQMNAILDLAIGLRWEESWCCDQYRTAFDLGWEHHIWFDHNHRNKTFDYFSATVGSTGIVENGFRCYGEATGNLGYGGLVIRLRFDF